MQLGQEYHGLSLHQWERETTQNCIGTSKRRAQSRDGEIGRPSSSFDRNLFPLLLTKASLSTRLKRIFFIILKRYSNTEFIQELQKVLEILGEKMDVALAEKQKCQDEADATATTIDLANRLVNGLASEKVRWAETVEV